MKNAAVLHRPDSEDAFLIDETTLGLRLKTGIGDWQSVAVYAIDPYEDLLFKTVYKTRKELAQVARGQVSAYWTCSVEAPSKRLIYLFELTDCTGASVLYGDRGFREATRDELTAKYNYFFCPYLHLSDSPNPPSWVESTIWYEIFPERFANGDRANDPAGTLSWSQGDKPTETSFYGGDLKGVLDHLDDLLSLGVTGLYFTPIFAAPSNHKYDTVDYFRIDPAFGDEALFKQLVDSAHVRGMRVMLDAVFNHIGEQSPQWQDVLQKGRQSRYASWFHLMPLTEGFASADTFSYETFDHEKRMPKLNTKNPEVEEFLLAVGEHWLREFHIDAWRFDVANEIDHRFWRRFCGHMRALKPDVYLLGEVWHSARSFLDQEEFDGVMNYPLFEALTKHFLTKEITAEEFVARVNDLMFWYRPQTTRALLNMLDSHDTPRALTLAKENSASVEQALLLLFLLPGSPCLYYGTEFGMSGGEDPDNRRTVDWQKLGNATWQRTRTLIALRKKWQAVLGQGDCVFSLTSSGLILLERGGEKGVTSLFNTTSHAVLLEAGGHAVIEASRFSSGQLDVDGYVVFAGRGDWQST